MTRIFLRYFQVLSLFWQTSIAAELEYRFNFLLSTLTSFGNLLGSIFGLYLFYRQDYNFAGWSWESALIVLSIFTILQGFSTIFLVPNLNRIVDHVQQGTLDFVLLKPINSQFWLSTRTISPWGLPDLIFGFLILGYASTKIHISPSNYVWATIPLILGIISLYSLWFMLGSMSIWFVKIYNVTDVLRGLLEAGRYPVVAYPIAYRFFFTFIVPVAFLTTVPAEILLGKGDILWIIGSGILATILFSSSCIFWKFALKFYTSASS